MPAMPSKPTPGKSTPSTVVTANRLLDGFVVYLTAGGGWSERLADAAVAASKEAAAALLAVAEAQARAGRVIGPYTFDVAAADGHPQPLGRRETIRTLGPSVRTDLGYQAAQH
jgi:hypothetical protein